jgi:hypothetical protein
MYSGMYSGTMIRDLMSTVERVEQRVELKRMADERELHAIFSMQIPVEQGERIYMGAA